MKNRKRQTGYVPRLVSFHGVGTKSNIRIDAGSDILSDINCNAVPTNRRDAQRIWNAQLANILAK